VLPETTPDADPRLGSLVLGRYRLVRFLATGGMGAIYLARTEGAAGFVRPVVIKRLLRVGDDKAGRMFAREARILAQLRHPGIVSIHDFAEDSHEHVMVLDYVHGYTLSDWATYLHRLCHPMRVDLAVHVVLRVLEALHHAHTRRGSAGELLGIVHRDVKPSNVLIDVQGDIKLADFGIARADTEVSATDTSLQGTFAFLAPELFAHGQPGPTTDVYSTAVSLYAVLRGSNPFATTDVATTVGRVLDHEPEPLDRLRGDVPPALAAAIARAMSKDPAKRTPDAEAFAAELRACGVLGEAVDERFRATVARDFADPRFAPMLAVASLDDRAAALSTSGDPRPPAATADTTDLVDREMVAASIRAIRVKTPTADLPTGQRRRRQRSRWTLRVAALGLVALAALATLAAWPAQPSPSPSLPPSPSPSLSPSPSPSSSPSLSPSPSPSPSLPPSPSPPPVITPIARDTLADMRALPLAAGDRAAAVQSHRAALLAHRAQRYGDAEDHWITAARLDPSWDAPFYNLACIAALENRVDDALAYLPLIEARGIGWSRLRRISADPDLERIRDRPELAAFVTRETARLCALPDATAPECATQPDLR
jgi:serine/threonine protein kinase